MVKKLWPSQIFILASFEWMMQKGERDGNNKNENGGYEAGSTNFYLK